ITKISEASAPQAQISLNPNVLEFGATVSKGNPPAKTVTLTNTGSNTLNWQATTTTASGGNWLSVSPSSGTLAANQSMALTVSIDARELFSDVYQGSITV